MPINTCELDLLNDRVTDLDLAAPDARQLSTLIGEAMRLTIEVAIPYDPADLELRTQTAGELKDYQLTTGLTPRQWRFILLNECQRWADQLRKIPSRGAENPQDASTLEGIARALKSSMTVLRDIADHDIEPVRIQAFNQSVIGRQHLAIAVNQAQSEVGMNPGKARPIVEVHMRQAYQDNLQAYLDEQFPTNSPDETRPTLNFRECLILAEDFFRAFGDPQDQDRSADELTKFMVEGQNRLRYNLPVEEGIATRGYWHSRISEGFDRSILAPNYDHLLHGPLLQDELPAKRVIGALENAGRLLPMNVVEPVIRYLDHDSELDNQAIINQLGQAAENRIVVFRDHQNRPAIATMHDPSLPFEVRVVRPGCPGMVGTLPDDEDLPFEEKAEGRIAMLSDLSEELTETLSADDIDNRLTALEDRWRNLVRTLCPEKVGTFKSELADLHTDIANISKAIVMPISTSAANLDPIRRITTLAFMSGFHQSADYLLRFRLPNGVGTRATGDQPDLEVVINDRGNGLSDIELKTIGEPASVLERVEAVPTDKATTVAREKAFPHGRTIGIANPAFPKGLVTYTLTDDKDAIPSGHWLSSGDRHECTTYRPLSLAHLKVKDTPLFLENGYRTEETAARLMRSTTSLLHGKSITPEQTMAAVELASYDGDYLLKIDLLDTFGCPKINVPELVYRTGTLEDIKRHLIQQVSLSELEPEARDDIVERIANSHWSTAEAILDEAECEMMHDSEPMVAPGL